MGVSAYIHYMLLSLAWLYLGKFQFAGPVFKAWPRHRTKEAFSSLSCYVKTPQSSSELGKALL